MLQIHSWGLILKNNHKKNMLYTTHTRADNHSWLPAREWDHHKTIMKTKFASLQFSQPAQKS